MINNQINKLPYIIFDINKRYIRRVFLDDIQYQREVNALLDCYDIRVQQIISFNDIKKIIITRYYRRLQPFTLLKYSELNFFIDSIIPIMDIITHCHCSGWCHGDIKPANILYNNRLKRYVLIDFSAALPLGYPRDQLNNWQYTEYYASTNQQRGVNMVASSDDWYSLWVWISTINLDYCSKREKIKIMTLKDKLMELIEHSI